MAAKTPWKNGNYLNDDDMSMIMKVNGKQVSYGSIVSLDYPDMEPWFEGKWTFGDFGEARQEVKKVADGIKNYNIDMTCEGVWTLKGILSKDGTKIIHWGFCEKVEIIRFVSDKALEKFKNAREQMNKCSVPYPLNPGKPGKIVWISGTMGSGKSTTGQMMAKNAGYVYYEADCLFTFLNPFVPLNVENPTTAAGKQKPLCGFSKEAIDAILQSKAFMEGLCSGNVTLEMFETTGPFVQFMAKDIKAQQKRIGGNFAVAFGIHSKKFRDIVRKQIPDVIFVSLKMSKEMVAKRLSARHGYTLTDEMLEGFVKIAEFFEGPQKGEKNIHEIEIREEMTRDDVLGKIMEKIK